MDILFQDEFFVAVNKPAGLLVHKTAISRDTTFLLQTLRNILKRRLFPVHRLDRATSGIVVFGLSSEAAAGLNRLFSAHLVQKTYLALVRGYFPDNGRLNYPVKVDNIRVDAVTEYKNLKKVELPYAVGKHPTSRYSLIQLKPKTGKRHQLRQHCKHLFHPIIGDTTYGDGRHNRFFREEFQVSRMMLHAEKLDFIHPFSTEPISIQAPLDEAWNKTLSIFT